MVQQKQMSYSEIKDMFIKLSCEQLNIDYPKYIKNIKNDADKDNAIIDLSMKMDSLDKMELVTKAEIEFGITISDEELNKMQNAEDMFKCICAKKGISVPQKTVTPAVQQMNQKKTSILQKFKTVLTR